MAGRTTAPHVAPPMSARTLRQARCFASSSGSLRSCARVQYLRWERHAAQRRDVCASAVAQEAATVEAPWQSSAYPFPDIERKWQQVWEEGETFKTPHNVDTSKPKYYVLDMFPYPSGSGLHVGHPEGYTATDIIARFKRMTGHNVLHPMGWDAFGLPAEQYALQTGTHPRVTTERNIAQFRKQLKSLGFSYDWSREVSTTDPEYYKWTQWIFTKLFERGLAYQAEVPVNWCPELGTVLANEEIVDGVSERGGFPVVRLPMKQWMLRITQYADRLLEDLDGLDWPDSIKEMQRNWIGRSEGATINFAVAGAASSAPPLDVFTTRPDTIFGATYMVVAPEHPLLETLVTDATRDKVNQYVAAAARKSDLERTELQKNKTGVFTGAHAINPATEEEIPIYVADYVLGSYGSGAIMAVPAHDERDHEFAMQFQLPIRAVRWSVPSQPVHAARYTRFDCSWPHNVSTIRTATIRVMAEVRFAQQISPQQPGMVHSLDLFVSALSRTDVLQSIVFVQVVADSDSQEPPELPFASHGVACNSTSEQLQLDGKPTAEAAAAVIAWLQSSNSGSSTVNYKLRDWLFARQRYWGEPFPVVYPENSDDVVPLPLEQLPLQLPEMDEFKPSGKPESPLINATEWLQATDPVGGGPARRDTNTMPQWAGSCWYYLRYIDPENNGMMVDPELEKYWMPVDLYVGGAEHAVLHLLYARFWHKVLYDIGVVSTKEPFGSLVSQGMILGETEYSVHRDVNGVACSPDAPGAIAEMVTVDDIEKRGDGFVLKADETVVVNARAYKMSKSRGNVVNPDDVVYSYGADSLRLYEMFMGPLRDVKVWSTQSVEGVHRFLARVHRLFTQGVEDVGATEAQLRDLHKLIAKVTSDTEGLRFNTAIAAMMEFMNATKKWPSRPRAALEPFALLLAPYAPHLAEECWAMCGKTESLTYEAWPQADEALLVESTISLPVQVNGKMRGTVEVAADVQQEEALAKAKAMEAVAKHLDGKEIKKVIWVPGKILNLVAK